MCQVDPNGIFKTRILFSLSYQRIPEIDCNSKFPNNKNPHHNILYVKIG